MAHLTFLRGITPDGYPHTIYEAVEGDRCDMCNNPLAEGEQFTRGFAMQVHKHGFSPTHTASYCQVCRPFTVTEETLETDKLRRPQKYQEE